MIIYRKFLSFIISKNGVLFNGDDALFKKALIETDVYGEYGCGASTNWVLRNTNADVISVDSSQEWILKVENDNGNISSERKNFTFADLGPVADWGYPIDYSKKDSFHNYTDAIWMHDRKPTTILIDGRFRVCCFLTSLKYANEGDKIIFDDYTIRPNYHCVEKFLQRHSVCGRQCLFIVPPSDQINYEELDKEILHFRYVME